MNSKKKKPRRNPLRIDPSQTALIRRAFAADMKRRFDAVRRNVWRLVSNGKAEGLSVNAWTDAARVASAEVRRLHHVYIHKIYFPEGLRSKEAGKEDFEQWKILARSRDDAARQIWEKHGSRLLGLMGSKKTKLPRIVSLFVSQPGIGSGGNAGRLQSIKVYTEALTTNTPRFVFLTDDRKVAEFNKWLQEQVDIHILEVSRVTGEIKGQKPWLYKYIDSAYRKGQVRAYTAARPQLSKPQPFYDGSKAQFLESSFRAPERVSKLKLLYTRAFQDLKGVTATMGSQIGRQLADGVAHGKSGQEIARGMSKTIKGLTKNRTRAIAHTEVINAHADGLLDAFEDLGVEEVNPDVEFTTSDDDGVCPICKALEGKIYTIKEARGVIPLHPFCRCSWSPVISIPKALKPKRRVA